MNWHDLPQDIKLEIFTFVSVKHFGKILSLSKTINQQVDESDYFWQQLCINYARVLQDQSLIEKTKALQNDQTEISKHEKYSKHLRLLIKTKEIEIVMLETKKHLEHRRLTGPLPMKLKMTRINTKEYNETKLALEKELETLKFD